MPIERYVMFCEKPDWNADIEYSWQSFLQSKGSAHHRRATYTLGEFTVDVPDSHGHQEVQVNCPVRGKLLKCGFLVSTPEGRAEGLRLGMLVTNAFAAVWLIAWVYGLGNFQDQDLLGVHILFGGVFVLLGPVAGIVMWQARRLVGTRVRIVGSDRDYRYSSEGSLSMYHMFVPPDSSYVTNPEKHGLRSV